MAQKETHILIATGGSLNDEIRVERIVIDESNMEDDDFDDFGEYADYLIDEAAGEYEQGFCKVLVINESQLPNLLGELAKINKL
jgi:hypothetical protein